MENTSASELRHRLLEALHGSKELRVSSDDRVSWSGEEILKRMAPIRSRIEALTSRGSLVAVAFPNSAAEVLAILSVIAAGRVPVILDHSDLSSAPLDWIRKSRASLLLAPAGIFGQVCAFALDTQSFLGISMTGEIEIEIDRPAEESRTPPPGTAWVLFTSGSAGNPKGIFVPTAGILATAEDLIRRFELDGNTLASITLPICHSMALNTQLIPVLLAGGSCHLMNPRLNLNRLYRSILNEKGTFISLIAETLQICAQEKIQRSLPTASEVRHIQLAGGMISPRHLHLARELFPNAVIHKGYGLTEAIRVTMISDRENGFGTDSVGPPLPFVRLDVRDPDGKTVSRGVTGEIFVKGPSVLLGTLESDVQLTQDGFLATGDLGYINNRNELCVAGRADGILKINGHRVATFGIEQAVIEISRSITNARCIAVEDPRRGGTRMVLLLEIPRDLQDSFVVTELDRIEKQIREKLSTLPHFPREIAITHRFPKTSNGKPAVHQLKELYLESSKALVTETSRSFIQFFRIGAA